MLEMLTTQGVACWNRSTVMRSSGDSSRGLWSGTCAAEGSAASTSVSYTTACHMISRPCRHVLVRHGLHVLRSDCICKRGDTVGLQPCAHPELLRGGRVRLVQRRGGAVAAVEQAAEKRLRVRGAGAGEDHRHCERQRADPGRQRPLPLGPWLGCVLCLCIGIWPVNFG